MSQANGIFPPRARLFATGRRAVLPKRQLGIEALERRCPMDASAAIGGLDLEPLLAGSTPPITSPSVAAITSTLQETPRSQQANQHALPPQPTQPQTQAQTKVLTAVRRAAPAKRLPTAESFQTPSLSDLAVTPGSDDQAAVGGGEGQLPLPSDSQLPSQRDESPGTQPADKRLESASGNLDSQNASLGLDSAVEESIDAEEPPRDPGSNESGTQLVGGSSDNTTGDPFDSSGEESTDPFAPPDPQASADSDCPALEPDPIRFISPPGPAGSIGLLPPGRVRNDYWTVGNAETDWDDDPEVIPGTSSVRQTRYVRSDSELSRTRYYESLVPGSEQPADAFRGRTTSLRAFAGQLEPLDGGIAIGATTGTPADYAALTDGSAHSANLGPQAEPEEAAAASHALQTDLAIAALEVEAAQAEQLAAEAAQSGIVVTAVGLTLQEQCASVQVCSRETGEEAVVVALSPAQDFLLNLSRWAALGLLVSHRLAHQSAGRGGLLRWVSRVRARVTGRGCRQF